MLNTKIFGAVVSMHWGPSGWPLRAGPPTRSRGVRCEEFTQESHSIKINYFLYSSDG